MLAPNHQTQPPRPSTGKQCLARSHVVELEKQVQDLQRQNSKLVEQLSTVMFKLEKLETSLPKVQLFKDSTRRVNLIGRPVFTITQVEKKRPETILIVDVVLCVYGEQHANICGTFSFGANGVVTTTTSQTDGFVNNFGLGKQIILKAVFHGHKQTGPQELSLSFPSGLIPFRVLNPNKTDHTQFQDSQTCSIITVTEMPTEVYKNIS